MREWIPHIGPLTRVIHLNLFLDMVPSSSTNFTRALHGQPRQLYTQGHANSSCSLWSLLQNKFGLVFFRLFDGALETSNFRFEEARSAITLLLCFLHENTQRGKIAPVKLFSREIITSTNTDFTCHVSKMMRQPSWMLLFSNITDTREANVGINYMTHILVFKCSKFFDFGNLCFRL